MIDEYFKNYFWTFSLGSLFLSAYMAAEISSVMIGSALAPPIDRMFHKKSPPSGLGPHSTTENESNAFLERNLFGAEREVLTTRDPNGNRPGPEGGGRDQDAIDSGPCSPSRCQASSVSANLLATLWYGDPDFSYAVFQPTSGGDVEVLGPGDALLEAATVTAVFRNMVCVSRAGACELFTLEDLNKKVQTPTSGPIAQAPQRSRNDKVADGIRKINDSTYEIKKPAIDKALSNLSQVARGARIVPSFKNGKSNGFKLFSIAPNSLYSKLGIENGDVVQKVNGHEIKSPDKALEVYAQLKDASDFTVDLLRRGTPQTMNYAIR